MRKFRIVKCDCIMPFFTKKNLLIIIIDLSLVLESTCFFSVKIKMFDREQRLVKKEKFSCNYDLMMVLLLIS